MPDYDLIQVSELNALETPSNTDVLPVQNGTELKKITFQNLKSAATGDKLNKPTGGNGTSGQMLLTNGDGSTRWDSPDDTLATTGKAADAKATGDAIKAVDANLAAPYSASATYAVGDYCTKDGVLKRCNTPITTAEAWNSVHWDDAKLGGDVSNLRNAFNSCFDIEEHTPVNLLDLNAVEEGCYYWTTGKNINASYNASGLIPVTEGVTYYFTRGTKTVAQGRTYFEVRFLVAYGEDGTTVVNSATNLNGQTGYTAPSGAKYIRISNATYLNATGNPMVQTISEVIDYVEYVAPYKTHILKASANNDEHINELIYAKISRHLVNGFAFNFDMDSDNHIFNNITELVQDMFGYSIQFTGRVTTLTDLVIGHGYNAYMGGYVRITSTDISYYLGTEASPRLSEAHNLTIKDYISIRIDAKPNMRADFTIYTNGGVYTKTNQTWDVRQGALSVRSNNGTNVLTGCTLSYMCKGWGEKIHLYGDSYFGTYKDKWTYYLTQNNWMKNNLNAYPGREASEALKILKNVVANSNPEKIVWCLGMNNADSGQINATWKAAVEELISICDSRNIELILATIPNVATVDNSYKNAYVRASGYRYIDFASAVGASDDTTWDDGMLSNDGVHPSTQGAIALFNQAIADVPELMN